MARGKYLSFEEARKKGTLKQFTKEHPSIGNEEVFDRLFEEMAGVTCQRGKKSPKGKADEQN